MEFCSDSNIKMIKKLVHLSHFTISNVPRIDLKLSSWNCPDEEAIPKDNPFIQTRLYVNRSKHYRYYIFCFDCPKIKFFTNSSVPAFLQASFDTARTVFAQFLNLNLLSLEDNQQKQQPTKSKNNSCCIILK